MELNTAQYQVVSWGRNSPSTRPCWRHPAEAARQRSPAGASGHQADHEPDMCQPHGKLTVCWAALSNVMPGGGGGNPSPLFSTSEAILGELGLVLASPVQETWSHWREASKGARKQGRDWSKCTMRKPERAGTAWPGEREVQGHLINVYKCPGGGEDEDGARPCSAVPSARTRSNGHQLEYERVPSERQEALQGRAGGRAVAQLHRGAAGSPRRSSQAARARLRAPCAGRPAGAESGQTDAEVPSNRSRAVTPRTAFPRSPLQSFFPQLRSRSSAAASPPLAALSRGEDRVSGCGT